MNATSVKVVMTGLCLFSVAVVGGIFSQGQGHLGPAEPAYGSKEYAAKFPASADPQRFEKAAAAQAAVAEADRASREALILKLKRPAVRTACRSYNFDMFDCQRIDSRQIWIGMTSYQLTLSRGKPTRVNRTVTQMGSDEQWVYENNDAYVYVAHDIVTSWQASSSQ